MRGVVRLYAHHGGRGSVRDRRLALGHIGNRESGEALTVALAQSRSAAFTEVLTEPLGLVHQ